MTFDAGDLLPTSTHAHGVRTAEQGGSPGAPAVGTPRRACRYVEMAVTSNFSFLYGASHPDELVERAAACGYRAVALTDRHTLAGIVRAHVAAKERGIGLVVGSRISLLADRDPERAAIGRLAGRYVDDPSSSTSAGRAPGSAGTYAGDDDVGAAFSPAPECTPCADVRCDVLVYPTDLPSYGQLCRLLTIGKRRAPKGSCFLTAHDLLEHGLDRRGGLLCTLLPPRVIDQAFVMLVEGFRDAYGPAARDCLSLALHRTGDPDDALRSQQLRALSEWTGVPLVAVNDVHYHVPERRPLQDVLTCIRQGCSIQRAGYSLFPNAERHLKSPERMEELFADMPEAVARTGMLADRCLGGSPSTSHAGLTGFSLDQVRYRYPSEVAPPGVTPTQHLRSLAWRGAAERYPARAYPNGVPERVRRQIEHELALIAELRYEPFFLTVHDLVRFARSRDILCQGRGAAANSAVCYCLGITAVDPNRIDVLFERFVSKERNEPPDIDVDFEHERREEVIQYLYRTYGRERAALTAEVISYRGRSAVRDVGKALGLSLDCVDRLAGGIDWWDDGGVDVERVREIGIDPRDPTIRRLAHLTRELLGFPRHLSQHVGGFVITDGPLCELVPIENAAMADRTVIEWDKDDIEAMGMLKVDVLALGMLTCVRKSIDLINADALADTRTLDEAQAISARCAPELAAGAGLDRIADRASPLEPLTFHGIPAEDPAVYDMICAADTVGVFQIESRAQMSMLPRLRPRCFYDLVIEVAIVRPGPIQGDMVHPYLRRRSGEEPITFPDDAVRAVLGKTLGVPLFQEQAMALAIVAAGFTAGEADQLRRAIGAWKRRGNRLKEFAAKLESGMIGRGYTQQFAQQVFRQIQGFSGYGFPESHAASFALIVYVSAWLKCHHPAAFAAALINSQPMGFYAPAQIVRDVREHGVEVRAIDVNASSWDCHLERSDPLVGMGGSRPPNADAMDGDGKAGRDRDGEPMPSDDARSGPVRSAAERPSSTSRRWSERASVTSGFRSAEPLFDRPLASNSRRQREILQDPLMCIPVAKRSIARSQPAMRLGMRLVRGLREEQAVRIVEAVGRHGPFASVRSLWRASGVEVSTLRRLAAADAFRSMGLDRQRALWQIRALRDEPAPLFEPPIRPAGDGAGGRSDPSDVDLQAAAADATSRSVAEDAPPRSVLPAISPIAAVAQDYTAAGLSLKRHPMACVRDRMARRGVVPCAVLRDPTLTPQRTSLAIAGVVLVRQRPQTANGILFMTIEDESGIANLIVRPKVYAQYRRIARQSVVVVVRGIVERREEVVHLLVRSMEDASDEVASIDIARPDADGRERAAALAIHARNFH